MKYIRLSGVSFGILLGAYYIYYDSYILVFMHLLLTVVSVIKIIQYDILKKNKQ